jgi:hypothetical protein
MSLTARDLFEKGLSAPSNTEPPANGSPRFRALVRRQVQSLDWLRVPLRYFDLQAFRPDPPTRLATWLGREPPRIVAIDKEWPRIRAEIDAGHPCVVGLIRTSGSSPWRLTSNHQVLAFAYDATDAAITVHVYDPNHPGRDDVELRAVIAPDTMDPSGVGRPRHERLSLTQTTGEPLLGFFRQPYPRPGSMRAWR